MRRFYKIIAILSLIIGFASCGEDFLNIDHTDIVTPDVLLTSQKNIEMQLNGVYDILLNERQAPGGGSNNDLDQNWNVKPHIPFSNYPALDFQAIGWEAEFVTHTWQPDNYMIGPAWLRSYRAIDRVNNFLANVERIDPGLLESGQAYKDKMMAEARAIRAWFYTFMIQTWGGVPMLMTGESYDNSPNKTRNSAEECWNMVIEDFEYAASNLDWKPRNGEYGRITKGMAKAYLGLAYMYQKRWNDAKKEFKDIIDSGEYDLNPCYAYIHSFNLKWQKESIWEIAQNYWGNMGWGTESTYPDAVSYFSQYYAGTGWGSWGPGHTTFEFVWSHEPGDKRVIYNVTQHGELNLGYPSIVLGETGSAQTSFDNSTAQPFVGGEILPNNYIQKYWRKHPDVPYDALPFTFMRLAGVMLNYAECCFETNDMQEGWKYVQLIRNRAWGKFETNAAPPVQGTNIMITLNDNPNLEAPDAETFYTNYKRTSGHDGGLINVFKGWMKTQDGAADSTIQYPYNANATRNLRRIGLFEKVYTECAVPYEPYTIPPWKVALIMERRHEFYGEFSIWQDLCRMDVAEDYFRSEYPKNTTPHIHITLTGDHDNQVQQLINFDYINKVQTWRAFDFQKSRQLFPIPTSEIIGNSGLTNQDQNPGYN